MYHLAHIVHNALLPIVYLCKLICLRYTILNPKTSKRRLRVSRIALLALSVTYKLSTICVSLSSAIKTVQVKNRDLCLLCSFKFNRIICLPIREVSKFHDRIIALAEY